MFQLRALPLQPDQVGAGGSQLGLRLERVPFCNSLADNGPESS